MGFDACTRALRDFFYSVHGDEMQAAVAALEAATGSAPPVVEDWEEVEFGFNKLFVGPMAPLAPPYASVYLEQEPMLMASSTMSVRSVYTLLGLVAPAKNSLPDDHVSLELDACLVMRAALQDAPSDQFQPLWRYFINDHMGRWVPSFVNKIRHAPDVHPVFGFVAGHLAHLIEQEIEALEHQNCEEA